MKLEELARQSSVAARASVAHLELPPIGEQSTARPLKAVLAGAAVSAALVAGLAFVVSNRSGDVADPADEVPVVVDVPRLALPEDSGWTVTFAADAASFGGRGLSRPTYTYYGTSATDDPFGSGDLLIATYDATAGAEIEPMPESEAIEVRGVTGRLGSGSDSGLPGDSNSIEWIENGADGTALHVILVSRSFDGERLLSIAEALAIDTAAAETTPDAGLGLDALATEPGTPFDSFGVSSEGSLIGYEREGNSLVLNTTRGDVHREAVVMRWWFASLDGVTIDGRPGYSSQPADMQAGMGLVTIWAPRDGVIANLMYFGADEAVDPIALAESAIELDDAAWEALVGQFGMGSTDLTAEYDAVFGEGSGEFEGVEYSWALGLRGVELCFDRLDVTSGSGAGSCQARSGIDPPAGSAVTIDSSSGERLAEVLIAADPVVDDVVEVEGRYTIDRVEADGLSWFVAIGDPAVQPSFEVIVDGEVVDTVEVAVAAQETFEPSFSDIPAAVELGIESMDIVFLDQTDPEFPRWIGRMGDDLCLVSGGAESTAACVAQTDITVFDAVPGSEEPLTFVVALDPPGCVVGLEVPGETYVSTNAGNADHDDLIVAIGSPSDPWQLGLVLDGAVERVDLPPTGGSAPYPPGLCEP